ncbi:MAG: acetolactate synthase small subunit [Myxococcales bacterium]|nr:acetolactate synthase small subunit [Myxococcales bacterium]
MDGGKSPAGLDKGAEWGNNDPVTESEKGALLPHTVVALVEDRPGVLARIVARWQERDFNIRSLAVGASEQPGLSRMTFVVEASTDADEMVAELRSLDEVRAIEDISAREFVSRELALIRVSGDREMRKRLMDIVDIFGAKIIDVSAGSMMIEVTGHENKINSLARLLSDYDVVEMVRTGRVSMLRG